MSARMTCNAQFYYSRCFTFSKGFQFGWKMSKCWISAIILRVEKDEQYSINLHRTPESGLGGILLPCYLTHVHLSALIDWPRPKAAVHHCFSSAQKCSYISHIRQG